MQLIMFFNGWGMDENAIKHLILDSGYKLECINFPYLTDHINFSNFEKIFVIGWSFGVFYASKFILENPHLKCYSIAINGTPYIIGPFGISPKMFNLTLETLSNENIFKFYDNMGASRQLLTKAPNLKQLQNELIYILENQPSKHASFDKVFLGKMDRIIPYSKQLKFYQKDSRNIISLDCEHYPFKAFTNWRNIISETNEF
ncbi:MAG: DUF452 family protein [Cetobacterium sp.]